MLTREDIKYSNAWVRIIYVWSVAAIVSYLTCFHVLVPLEEALAALIAPDAVELYGRASLFFEVEALFLFALLLGVPRIRLPFLMIIYVAAILFAYTSCILGVFYLYNVILPLAAPLLSICAGAAVLGSLAWHEEQNNFKRLQDLEKMHQQLTDMLVHDLKKKLSSLMMSISMLKKENPSKNDSEMLTTLKTSSEQMLLLVTNLLDIRKLEVGKMNLRKDRIHLKELLLTSIDEHRPVADMLDLKLVCLAEDDVTVSADRQMISRVIMNLIWNAIQHAPQNTEIEIGCRTEKEHALVRVANRGAVIPDQFQEHLFKPFQAGSNDSLGGILFDSTGLGLAFCKLAIEAHGGQIEVESPWENHDDGVLVTVTFDDQPSTLQ